ncbi:MAG: hypothetical protein ABEJ22_09250 [Haloferacaceae archaeon]
MTLALVGGPLSLVYLLVAVDVAGTDRLRELLAGFAPEDVSPAGALLASVATALLVVALARVSFPLVTGYLAALALLWVVVSARHTAGELDVEARTLSTETGGRRRTFDVSTLASFSAVAVGGYVVCLLRYEAGTVSNPFLAVFPAADWPAVREGLERLREAEAGSVQPAVRVALAAFGLLFLGVAGGVVLLGGRSGAGPAVAYAVVALGGLGLLMVVLAAMG